jgi:hypothetical protein
MMSKFVRTKAFAAAAAIRAARTAAQTLVGAIGATALLEGVDWPIALSTTGLATILSVLNSVATGLPEADEPGQHAAAE